MVEHFTRLMMNAYCVDDKHRAVRSTTTWSHALMDLYRKLVVGVLSMAALQSASAQQLDSQRPLLLVGASFAEAKTPFANGVAPLGGISVALGSYLSLGNA